MGSQSAAVGSVSLSNRGCLAREELFGEYTLTQTFFAVQGKWGRRHRQGRKWISVPISSTAPVSDPGRISNTMFYKLMFLEVGQGYPQPWRRRRTSSVSQKRGSDPETERPRAILTPPVSDFTGAFCKTLPYKVVLSHICLVSVRLLFFFFFVNNSISSHFEDPGAHYSDFMQIARNNLFSKFTLRYDLSG